MLVEAEGNFNMKGRNGSIPKEGRRKSNGPTKPGPGRNKEPRGRVDKGTHGGDRVPRSLDKVGPPKEESWGMTGSERKKAVQRLWEEAESLL